MKIVNEDVVVVEYNKAKKFVESSPMTNVIVASFVTTYTRLKLYGLLEKLGSRAFYCDTDSVFYSTKEDEETLPHGTLLGELTDELKGCDMVEFASGGPKNYGYRTKNRATGEEEGALKIKGFTLDYDGQHTLNYAAMKKSVERFAKYAETRKLSVTRANIRRTKDYKVVTKDCKKDYRVVFNKRVLVPDIYNSVPYGYKP